MASCWLERAPATFTDEVSEQMCEEMFNIWIDEETAAVLSRLASETSAPKSISDFSDVVFPYEPGTVFVVEGASSISHIGGLDI